MKTRPVSRGELVKFHESMVKRSEAEIRAAARSLASAKDRKRHHELALKRLEEVEE